jgi:hypothetical protein
LTLNEVEDEQRHQPIGQHVQFAHL